MNEHAVDSMIYAWLVMKEKEENKMEGIFMGQITGSVSQVSESDGKRCATICFHDTESNACGKLSHYNKTYSLVLSDDVIKTNDELLKLRDECNDWKVRYSTVNNELFQKGLAYGTLETAYKNEKIAGEMLLKDRDALKEKVEALIVELTEIKTARTLREAYIAGVEKGCESLREERDTWKRRFDTADKENQNLKDQKKRLSDMAVYWNNRFTSVMTDFGKVLEANGITFAVKNIDNDGNWDVAIDIPELDEAKAKVADLEKKVKVAESKETYWRDRKEEEEDYHHYWLHTFDRAVKKAAEKGIHIGVCGNDEDCNAGIVTLDNMKAEGLEKQVTTLTDSNKKLNQQVLHLEKDYQNLKEKLGAADNALEYWNNTYNDIVIAGKNVGVKIDIKGKKSDTNAGFVYVANEKAIELMVKVSDTKHWYSKKWQAMLDALKAKGVEVLYMGEEDGKPNIDVKIPEIGDLKKELENLKSKTVAEARYEVKTGCLTLFFTMCDGSEQVFGMDSSEAIDATSISCGTVPKCSSCAHYMHNPSRYAHDWCYRPVPKEGGAGYIRKLNKEEAEGPACSDFKARKE